MIWMVKKAKRKKGNVAKIRYNIINDIYENNNNNIT